ncbi:MAG: acyl-CoA/acyl-ACP dehydrogenase [Actinobacteria bacterium]|nr:acyl-CoA/acyl-ACP dehydrogenase [Actinomycetota bacterium]MCB9389568.1 acyl-CoA/acyl-ACP dehydrogenase [Acidimicrobiia bacterium]
MDFQLNADQLDLVDAVQAFCIDQLPMSRLRTMEGGPGVDRDTWAQMGDMGWFALSLAPDDGGVGLGLADAALVFEQAGRFCAPGPIMWSHLAAGLIDGAAQGAVVVGGVERPAAAIDGATMPAVIEYPDACDVLIVVDDDGLWRIDPATLSGRTPRPTDPLTPVKLVADLPQGDQIAGAEVAATWKLRGRILTAALMVGLADRLEWLSVGYAAERFQFNRPIGSFQSIKHLLADMHVRTEMARAQTYAAAVTWDQPDIGDAARAAAAALVVASGAVEKNGDMAVQVHGGMGYTWEVDVHFFLKRGLVARTWWSGTEAAAEDVAASLVS